MSQPAVGDHFADLTAPPTFSFRGKGYAVRPPTLATVALFEAQVARQMRDNLEELRPVLSDAEYAAEVAALREQLLVKKSHAFGGAANAAKLNDDTGASLLFWSYVASGDPSFTPAMAFEFVQESPDEFVEIFAAVTPDFFRAAGKRRGMSPAKVEQGVELFRAQSAAYRKPPTPTPPAPPA